MKRYGRDLLITAAAFLALLVLFLLRSAAYPDDGGRTGKTVVITTEDGIIGTYPLDEDRTVEVDTSSGHNTVVISAGSVRVSEATCRDGICIRTGKIHTPGRSIVCLPNRVSVTILSEKGGEEDGYDAVAY